MLNLSKFEKVVLCLIFIIISSLYVLVIKTSSDLSKTSRDISILINDTEKLKAENEILLQKIADKQLNEYVLEIAKKHKMTLDLDRVISVVKDE